MKIALNWLVICKYFHQKALIVIRMGEIIRKIVATSGITILFSFQNIISCEWQMNVLWRLYMMRILDLDWKGGWQISPSLQLGLSRCISLPSLWCRHYLPSSQPIFRMNLISEFAGAPGMLSQWSPRREYK